MTFRRNEYESMCAAMAMVDAVLDQLEDSEAADRCGWSADLIRMRNEMNDARIALLKAHGERVWHVDDIPGEQPPF